MIYTHSCHNIVSIGEPLSDISWLVEGWHSTSCCSSLWSCLIAPRHFIGRLGHTLRRVKESMTKEEEEEEEEEEVNEQEEEEIEELHLNRLQQSVG